MNTIPSLKNLNETDNPFPKIKVRVTKAGESEFVQVVLCLTPSTGVILSNMENGLPYPEDKYERLITDVSWTEFRDLADGESITLSN